MNLLPITFLWINALVFFLGKNTKFPNSIREFQTPLCRLVYAQSLFTFKQFEQQQLVVAWASIFRLGTARPEKNLVKLGPARYALQLKLCGENSYFAPFGRYLFSACKKISVARPSAYASGHSWCMPLDMVTIYFAVRLLSNSYMPQEKQVTEKIINCERS